MFREGTGNGGKGKGERIVRIVIFVCLGEKVRVKKRNDIFHFLLNILTFNLEKYPDQQNEWA